MTQDPDLPTIEPGSILLERYRAEEMLGVGGMGLVVAATHTTLGNKVAIKFLLPKFATSHEAAARFVREARAASKIQSEHVARVLDTGTSPTMGPFIVMEYLEGGDLARHVRGPHVFAIAEVIDYVVQACEALAHAHNSGIVHRDVKPANLFLGTRPDGLPIVKVLDFGISKVAEDSNDMGMTKTTAILGSGYYMSPEQMRSSKNVDHRTDIYGLGITMYEILTKTVPFSAESFADLAIKVAVDPPDPLVRHRPDVPPELAAVIERAYAKKPDERYQSVGELAVALAPWAAVETLPVIESVARISGSGGARLSIPPAARYSTPPPSGYPPAPGGHRSASYPPGSLPPPARLPSIPPPYLGGPMSAPPSAHASSTGNSTGGSAPALALTNETGSSKTLIGAALALVAVVAVGVGAGLYVRGRGAAPAPAATPTMAAPAPSAPEPVVSAEPAPSASSVAATGSAEASAAPPASASAVPSVSAAPLPTGSLVARPRPVRSAAPSAAPAPQKLCEVFNPDKGLREIVPCP